MSNKERYLGLILDRRIFWNDHVESKVKVAKQYSKKLLCAGRTTLCLKPFTLRNLHKANIESTILLAIPTWLSALNKNIIRKSYYLSKGFL